MERRPRRADGPPPRGVVGDLGALPLHEHELLVDGTHHGTHVAGIIAGRAPLAKVFYADNGSAGYISGFSNPLFNDDALHTLNQIKGQDLEVVDTSKLR